MPSINTEEWLAELDRVADLCGGRTIVATGGFTVKDVMARGNSKRVNTSEQLRSLEAEGKIRFLGYRPGSAGEKVYELVRN